MGVSARRGRAHSKSDNEIIVRCRSQLSLAQERSRGLELRIEARIVVGVCSVLFLVSPFFALAQSNLPALPKAGRGIQSDRPVNRSDSALGIKPHQAAAFMKRLREDPAWNNKLKLTQDVPSPYLLDEVFPNSEPLKDYHKNCAQLTIDVRPYIRDGTPMPRTLAADYDSKCLGRLDSLPAQQREWLRKRLVVLQLNGASTICTGLLLSPRVIVTAQHCFYFKESGERISWNQIRVRHLGAPAGAWRLAKDAVKADGARLPELLPRIEEQLGDIAFAVLTSAVDVGTTRDPLPLAPMTTNGRLIGIVIPGFHASIANAMEPNPTAESWAAYIRRDASPGCFIKRVEDSDCYLHSCHSGPGMSGSPVLVFKEDDGLQATLVAIHSGARDRGSNCVISNLGVLDRAAPNLANFPQGPLFNKPAMLAVRPLE